jgi:hypothetical protein
MASSLYWLPGYEGDVGGEETPFLPVYAALAGIAAVAVRGQADSRHAALVRSGPAIGVLAGAAICGLLSNASGADGRGGPIYLFYGVALWASWAATVIATAIAYRTRWDGLGGIAVTCLVAVAGLALFIAQVD